MRIFKRKIYNQLLNWKSKSNVFARNTLHAYSNDFWYIQRICSEMGIPCSFLYILHHSFSLQLSEQASMWYVNSCCGGVILFWWSFHLFHLFRNFHQPLRKVDYRLWGYSRELVEWRVKCRLDECAMREYLNSALMWYLDRVLSWCHYRVVLWCVQGRCSVIELACKSSFANWQKIACQLAD